MGQSLALLGVSFASALVPLINLEVYLVGLGAVAGDVRPVVGQFLATFSNEKFVVPICSAMGFAYVLRATGCDRHMVRVLVAPLRRVRFLMVPGVLRFSDIPVLLSCSISILSKSTSQTTR